MGCVSSQPEPRTGHGGSGSLYTSSKGRKYVKQASREELALDQQKNIRKTFSQVYKVDRLLGTGEWALVCRRRACKRGKVHQSQGSCSTRARAVLCYALGELPQWLRLRARLARMHARAHTHSFANTNLRVADTPTRPGAEGNAWLVRDINTHKYWALKLLKLPLPARFVQSVFRCAPGRCTNACVHMVGVALLAQEPARGGQTPWCLAKALGVGMQGRGNCGDQVHRH